MIAIDSNILVRIAVNDDPEQGSRAERLIAGAARGSRLVFVSLPVILETVWTLRRSYKKKPAEISAFIAKVLSFPHFHVDGRDILHDASGSYAEGRADFADYLIASLARRAGATATYSFDEDGLDEGIFAPVPS